MVEPPPRLPPSAAAVRKALTVASRSKPGFSQKVSSSVAVVTSRTSGGMSVELDDLAALVPELGQLHLAVTGRMMLVGSEKSRSRNSCTSGRPWSSAAMVTPAAPPAAMTPTEATPVTHDDADEHDGQQGAGPTRRGLAGGAASDGETRGVGTPMMGPVPVAGSP